MTFTTSEEILGSFKTKRIKGVWYYQDPTGDWKLVVNKHKLRELESKELISKFLNLLTFKL